MGRTFPSLPGLGCSRMKTSSTMAGSQLPSVSPYCPPIPAEHHHLHPQRLIKKVNPFLMVIPKKRAEINLVVNFLLLASHQFSPFILSDCVLGYLRSCIGAMPSVSLMSAWILRHEHHLLYLLLRLLTSW